MAGEAGGRGGRSGTTSIRRPASGGRKAGTAGAPPPLSPWRRAGVLAVVGGLLISILLAMGGTRTPDAPDPTPPPAETTPPDTEPTAEPLGTFDPSVAPPVVTPVITPPEEPTVAEATWNAVVTIDDPGVPLASLRLAIYRNDKQVMDLLRVKELTIAVKRIPLKKGENRIEAALVNTGGIGPRSLPVVITLDTTPPRVEIRSPGDGDTVTTSTVTVKGSTDPGITVVVRNTSTGAEQTISSDDRGIFAAEVRVTEGQNRITVSAVDAIGNSRTETVNVTVGTGRGEANLVLSRKSFALGGLPEKISIRLELTDVAGRDANGAPVTFSISVPGQATETWQTTAVDGVAVWKDVTIPSGDTVAGEGLVTARAEVSGGAISLEDTEPIYVR